MMRVCHFLSLLVLLFPATVFAQNICDAVLKPHVFNVGESSNVEAFASRFHDAFCDTLWESRKDIESRGSSFGFTGSNLESTLGISQSDYSSKDKLSQKYTQFCKRTTQDIAYSSSFFNRYRSSDFAVSQWRECVKTAEGHFAIVVPDQGLEGAIITLTRRQSGQVGTLSVKSVETAGGYDVACTFNGVEVTKARFPENQREVAIACKKRADLATTFVINTNWGTFESVYIPGMQKTITALQTELAEAKAKFERKAAELTELISSVSSKSLKRCRVCFWETERSDQCQGSLDTCSEWATAGAKEPAWTAGFRDDTDGRPGGCKYQWRLQCE